MWNALVPPIWRNQAEHLSALTSPATHSPPNPSLASIATPSSLSLSICDCAGHSLVFPSPEPPLPRLPIVSPYLTISGGAAPRIEDGGGDGKGSKGGGQRWRWGWQAEQGRRSSSCVGATGLASGGGGRGAVAEARRAAAVISSCCSPRHANCDEYLSTLHAYGHYGPELVFTGPSTSHRQPSGAHSPVARR